MKTLVERWRVWAVRLDALSFRERVLVFLAVAGLTLAVLFVGLIEPALKEQSLMLQTASDLRQESFSLREQLASGGNANPDGRHAELQRLEQEIEAAEQRVKARERGFIEPARMVPALKSLLAEAPGLRLVSLETEAARPAVETKEGEAAPADTLYKHGIVLRIEGGYAPLTDYLARLERMPWSVQWESLRIDASRHPHLELTLKLNTLSREPTWARL